MPAGAPVKPVIPQSFEHTATAHDALDGLAEHAHHFFVGHELVLDLRERIVMGGSEAVGNHMRHPGRSKAARTSFFEASARARFQ